MSESSSEARPKDFVPASFEDLRRTTREESAAFEAERQAEAAGPRDFVDMVADRDFMKKSGRIGTVAIVLGLLLIFAANFKALFMTADAVHTAAAVSADKAGASVDDMKTAVGGIADKAAVIKAQDTKALDTAKSGLTCLTGKGGCPQGGGSPFK
jgi:hypothetical protein